MSATTTPLDLLHAWSTLSTGEIAERLASGADAAAAARLFGASETAELIAAAPEAPARRSSQARSAVVLIPGIMGSQLASVRGLTTLLWLNPLLLLRGQAAYLQLDDAGEADRHPAIHAVATALDKLCYLKPALVLRREVDLYEFPYDWRRSITHNAGVLARGLERWAAGTDRRFTLLGHSMGGLVARAYLARHPRAAERRLERVISLGTPYFGTAEAVRNLAVGNTLLEIAERLNPANRAGEVVLSMPSVYQLLPAPPDLLPPLTGPVVNWDVYSRAAWRLAGLSTGHLRAGAGFHQALAKADPQVAAVQIAGCNIETIVRVERKFTEKEEPVYSTISRDSGEESGDGPVPLWSAVHPKIYTYYVEEQHRYLPANKAVLDAVLELAYGGAPCLHETIPPKHNLLPLRQVEPLNVSAHAVELRHRIEAGTATEADLAQLYFAG